MPPNTSPAPDSGRFAFDVGGVSYESTKFRVLDGLRLSLALTGLGGEAVVAFLGGLADGTSALDADVSGLDLSRVRKAFTDGTLEALIFDLLRNTYRGGVSLDSKVAGNGLDAFRGRYLDLYAVALKVVEGNGFLPVPDGLLGALKASAAKALAGRSSIPGSDESATG